VLEEIVASHFDEYIRRVATDLRETEQPVLLRFAHEMDLKPDGVHPWFGAPPALYIDAWRHVVALFREEGADNVLFLWSPGGVIEGGRFYSDDWYPGADVVDLVGFSAFAFWQWEESNPARAATHAFRSPAELILPRYQEFSRYGKPMVLPEVGVKMHPSRIQDEAGWLRQFGELVGSESMPLLRAVVYFNAPHNLPNYEVDWRLQTAERVAVWQSWVRESGFITAEPLLDPPEGWAALLLPQP
jgi:beta-mannanase